MLKSELVLSDWAEDNPVESIMGKVRVSRGLDTFSTLSRGLNPRDDRPRFFGSRAMTRLECLL